MAEVVLHPGGELCLWRGSRKLQVQSRCADTEQRGCVLQRVAVRQSHEGAVATPGEQGPIAVVPGRLQAIVNGPHFRSMAKGEEREQMCRIDCKLAEF